MNERQVSLFISSVPANSSWTFYLYEARRMNLSDFWSWMKTLCFLKNLTVPLHSLVLSMRDQTLYAVSSIFSCCYGDQYLGTNTFMFSRRYLGMLFRYQVTKILGTYVTGQIEWAWRMHYLNYSKYCLLWVKVKL